MKKLIIVMSILLSGCSDKDLTNQQLFDMSQWCRAHNREVQYIYSPWYNERPVDVICIDKSVVYNYNNGKFEHE